MRTAPAIVLRLRTHWPNSGLILGTSLSVFLGCYRPGYRSRQKPVEDALRAHQEILGAEMSSRLISRFRNAMAQKLGQTGFPSGDPAQEFSEAVEIARATWNWESGQLLGTNTAAGDWRGIFARLSSLETAAQRSAWLGSSVAAAFQIASIGTARDARRGAGRFARHADLRNRMRDRFLLGRDRIG